MPLLRQFFRFRTVFLCALLLFFAGCTGDGESLLDWRSSPASFTLYFPSAYGETVCTAERDGEHIRLAAASDSSAETTILCTPGGCSISFADGTEIPLSAKSASALTAVFAVLYEADAASVIPQKSADGTKTVLHLPGGTLFLGEDLLPCAVECAAQNGEMRTVRIENYTLLPEPSEFSSTKEG